MQQTLVLGGAGFIGSNLAKHLINAGHKIVIIDDLSTGCIDNISDINCEFIQLKIKESNFELINEYVKSSNYVIHLAATVGVKNVIENCYDTIKNNIEATEVVLQSCKRYRKRCIVASTSEVYGKNESELSEHDDITLGSPYKNRWSYAVSKLIDEFLTLDLYKKYKLQTTIVRFFNISGPGQVSHYGMVIPKFIDQAIENKPITIFSDGLQTRCFTHIDDVVKILEKLLNNEKSYGKIINIGNPEEVEIINLALYIRMKTKSASDILYNQEKNIYSSDFEDMKRRFPNIYELNSILKEDIKWLSYKDIVDDILKSKGL